MYQETPDGPTIFMRDYLISMTAFSMMSTAMFSFPVVLQTDKINNWQKTLRHTLSHGRILSIKDNKYDDWLFGFNGGFSVGHLVRGDMPP